MSSTPMSSTPMSSTPNNSNFDLSNVFQVQSNYLSDITDNALQNVDNSAEVAKDIYNLQEQLQKTSNVYADANTSSAAVLNEQEKVMSIIETEQKRLDAKQDIVDNAMVLEERKALLTNTQRLQYTAYTKMMLVLVAGLCFHVVLRFLSGGDSESTGMFIPLLHITNILVCAIIVTYMYINIQSRSEINFNHLNIPPPNSDNFNKSEQPADFDNLFNGVGCIDNNCCGDGTQWNDTTKVCAPLDDSASPEPESFATYNEIYNIRNELLPCKVTYPYKDSANAQPNDNVKYMKSYQ